MKQAGLVLLIIGFLAGIEVMLATELLKTTYYEFSCTAQPV